MARIAALAPLDREVQPGGPSSALGPEALLRGVEATHTVDRIPPQPSLLERLRQFDLTIYEIGSEWPAYGPIYEAAVGHPGLVVLRTPLIGDLVRSLAGAGTSAGLEAAAEARARTKGEARPGSVADGSWCARLVRRSLGIVVSNAEDQAVVRALRFPTPVHLLADEPETIMARAVDESLTRLRDPLHRAVHRWASALAQCGGTVDLLAKGHGGRYADVLEAMSSASG
jgi:hypothetical protein